MNGKLLLLGLSGPELTTEEEELFKRLQPTGYILFSRNIATPEQTRALTDHLRSLHYLDPIIGIDQEGGRVTRTKDIAPSPPSAQDLAALGEPVKIADAGVYTGDLLRLLGFNLNFAPVLDLDHHVGADNALRGRCWGQDSQAVINGAGMWNRWHRKRSMRTCAKHFPACGRAISDPHHDLPVVEATLDELLADDVIPYTALMPEIDSVMVGHVQFPNIDPESPGSLSHRIISSFLRDQLGFDRHLVMTDDLDMGAISKSHPNNSDVVAAIRAGNDLAMICHEFERVNDAAGLIGELPDDITHPCEKRIEKFRKKLPISRNWDSDLWSQTCEKIEELAASVPSSSTQEKSNSPVEDY